MKQSKGSQNRPSTKVANARGERSQNTSSRRNTEKAQASRARE